MKNIGARPKSTGPRFDGFMVCVSNLPDVNMAPRQPFVVRKPDRGTPRFGDVHVDEWGAGFQTQAADAGSRDVVDEGYHRLAGCARSFPSGFALKGVR